MSSKCSAVLCLQVLVERPPLLERSSQSAGRLSRGAVGMQGKLQHWVLQLLGKTHRKELEM